MRKSSYEEVKTTHFDSTTAQPESSTKDSEAKVPKQRTINPIRDDSAIDKMKKDEEDEIKFEVTEVRKRQRTCHISALAPDEVFGSSIGLNW